MTLKLTTCELCQRQTLYPLIQRTLPNDKGEIKELLICQWCVSKEKKNIDKMMRESHEYKYLTNQRKREIYNKLISKADG